MAASDKGQISLRNYQRSALSGSLIITPKAKLIKSMLFTNETASPELTLTLPKGVYKVELKKTEIYDLSYFYGSCTIRENKEEGPVPVKGSTYTSTGEGEVTLTFRCVPFDFGIEETDSLKWQMRIVSTKSSERIWLNIGGRASKEINLPKLSAGKYQVEFANSVSYDKIDLGQIEVE